MADNPKSLSSPPPGDSPGILSRMGPEKSSKLLGDIVLLMLESDLHREYLVNDIGTLFLTPVNLNQFRIYHEGARPVGFVSWAWLSDDVEQAYIDGKHGLGPADWTSGPNGWIIDFIAPFGHAKSIVRDLRRNVFPGQKGKAMRSGREKCLSLYGGK